MLIYRFPIVFLGLISIWLTVALGCGSSARVASLSDEPALRDEAGMISLDNSLEPLIDQDRHVGMDDVVVVTLTDFGRTARENGTNGTDHGWANCMFLLGGPVAKANQAVAESGQSRKVVTNWPGLAKDQLHEGRDLLHTTDFRDVLAELVQVHLGNTNLKAVMPQHEFKSVGLIA